MTTITQSVINKPSCNVSYAPLLILRTIGSSGTIIPITTLDGRTTGKSISFSTNNNESNVDFTRNSYEELKMRRKAEVLTYTIGSNATGIKLSNNNKYNSIVKTGGYNNYSNSKLKLIQTQNNGIVPSSCLPQNRIYIISPPSNSGVVDYKTPGYYLDPYVDYNPYL
jgi:hypothetical protein